MQQKTLLLIILKILASAILLTFCWVAASAQTREIEANRHLATAQLQKDIFSNRLIFENAKFGRLVYNN